VSCFVYIVELSLALTKYLKQMKKILAPTDFSETAKNAASYAIELAKLIKAEVILLHVFDVPVAATDVSIVMPSPQELEEINAEALKNSEQELKRKHGDSVIISGIVKMGFLVDETIHLIKEKRIDIIVMGITGAGKLAEVLMGSNATRVAKKINCPTIIVPEKAKFSQLKNIAFACDYNEIEESGALDQLVDFVKLFDARLMIVNIGKQVEKHSYSNDLAGKLLEYIFENINESLDIPNGINYSIHQQKDEDVVHGINKFLDKHNADLLVMIPRKHSLLWGLFHESNTKKMAFHTHVPILALHEEH